MKRLLGLLNLLLCLELIIGPHFPGARIFTSEVAKAQTCPSGLVFDSTLNRCITSDQNAAVINATMSCNGDRECYKRLAEEELKKGVEEGKITAAVKDKGGLFNKALGIAAVAGPLLVAYTFLTVPKKCTSPSMYAMLAGGVVHIAGEVMTNGKHKSCLKKIREEWESKKTALSANTAPGVSKVKASVDQSEAFEMLAKSEECMEKTAKTKAGFHAASTLAFGASAVLAGIEMTNPATNIGATCVAYNEKQPVDNLFNPENLMNLRKHEFLISSTDLPSYLTIQEYIDSNSLSCSGLERFNDLKQSFSSVSKSDQVELLSELKKISLTIAKEINPFSISDAEANALMLIGPSGALMAGLEGARLAALTHVGPLNAAVVKPLNRLIFSGVIAAWSATMWMHANKQARASKNRAEFLRELKKGLLDATGAISCTSEERNSSVNPNCYCYTESGQRNSARLNSQVCQQLFAGTSPVQPGNSNNPQLSSERVCIAQNGTADAACSCAKTKSCLNAIPGGISNLGIGAISAATSGLQPLNDISNGNIAPASINGAAALGNAARLLDSTKKLEKSLRDPAIAAKKSKLAQQIEGALITAGAGVPLTPMGNNESLNLSPSQAAGALEKELSTERSFERVSGSPAIGQPGDSTPGDETGFSLGVAEPIVPSQESQLAEVMNQDLNYEQADITKSDSNIFQILTNRYQRSGMKRLFDESEKSSPEPANKNDISP